MINIKSFGVRRKDGGSSSSNSSSGGFANTTIQTEVNGINIWGQYHDHNSDIDGDITTSGNITAQGDITTNGAIDGNTIHSQTTIEAEGALSADDGIFSGDVHCVDIDCSNINCAGDIEANNVETNELSATDGTITNLVAEYLTVTKQAHFFELVIDKIKSNAGQIIVSAANATLDKVDTSGNYYILYWRKQDPETEKTIENMFIANDQVICQTFNLENDGNTVNNRYYWGLVYDAGETTLTENGETTLYNYIRLDPQFMDIDSVSIPQAGDEIVQLGYRGNDDAARQSAIIISSYKSPDPNAQAPSIVQYSGINDYTLNGKILNKIAADGTTLTGNFKVVTGNTTTDVVDLVSGTIPTIVSDSDAAFVIADSNSKMHSISDAQGLPTNIKLFEGDTQIDFRYWTANSYIKNGTQSKVYFNGSTIMGIGLYISKAEESRNSGCDITWGYAGSRPDNEYTISNHNITVYIEYIVGNETKTIQKNIPMNVIKSGATVAGADAEFDKMKVNDCDLTVQVSNVLNITADVQVMHIKGDTTTILSDLTDYSCYIQLNNGGNRYTLTRGSNKFTFTQTVGGFMNLTNPPTSARLILQNDDTNTIVDTFVVPIKFNAGSMFEIKEDAITAAVQQSNTYTDGEITTVNADIAQVQLTAQGLNSRITNIEGDYVTSSQLTQTANNIQLNVYNELHEKTGIDVANGQITLNANNTIINGNLNLNNTDNGITVYDDDGTARIQIQPQPIGSINDFDSGTTYYVRTSITASNQSTYSQTTEKKKIGYFSANDTLTMNSIKLYLQSTNGTTTERPTADITATIKLYKDGTTNPVQTYTKTFTYTNGEYNTSSITYTIPSNGVYLFNATITYNATPLTYLYEEVYAVISQTIQHQTYIGSDGFYCNPYTNSMLWAGSDEISMQWNGEGIMVNGDGMQRLPYQYIIQQPLWYPIDNITTVTKIYDTDYILYNNKYTHIIDPFNDKGLLCCTCASWNESGKTTHIQLPPTSFTLNGNRYTLPIGYKVSVVNLSAIGYTDSWSTRQYIYVDDVENNRQWQVVSAYRTFVMIDYGTWSTNA